MEKAKGMRERRMAKQRAKKMKRRSEDRDKDECVLDRAGHKKKVRLGGGGKSGVKT